MTETKPRTARELLTVKVPAQTLCPHCGTGVAVDEDGCCASCGCDAAGMGVDEVLAALRAEADRADAAERERDEARAARDGALSQAEHWRRDHPTGYPGENAP